MAAEATVYLWWCPTCKHAHKIYFDIEVSQAQVDAMIALSHSGKSPVCKDTPESVSLWDVLVQSRIVPDWAVKPLSQVL